MEQMVSVVLPVYNGEKYLKEAVDSILEQTYHDFELIVINDGSTDSTFDILLEYQKKDPRVVIISRANRGLVDSLNEGIKIARGKYIARMDADDVAHPTRIEKQVSFMEDHDDVYILGTNYSLIYEEGTTEEVMKAAQGTHKRSMAPIEREDWFLSTNETMKFIHPTIMIRKSLFDAIGLYKYYKLEDLELYFRTGSNGYRIDKLEEVLLDYRVRSTSKSRTDARVEQTKELMEVKMKYLTEGILDANRPIQYLIWGADISGDLGIGIIQRYMPNAKFLGYIDSFKSGELNGYPIIRPDEISAMNADYIFVCTNGGAVFARETLKEKGFVEGQEFFKIS